MSQHRALGGQVRAAGARTVTLRPIRPGVVDDYGSVWMADAFDASLRERLPVLAWSHDWSEPIGVGISYTTGRDGPTVTCRFDDFAAVPRARQAYAQVKSGTIRDCSVGFSKVQRRDPTTDELEQYPGVREVILSARMDELSLVLAGAVPGAEVLAVRSAGRPSPRPGSLDAQILSALAIVDARY